MGVSGVIPNQGQSIKMSPSCQLKQFTMTCLRFGVVKHWSMLQWCCLFPYEFHLPMKPGSFSNQPCFHIGKGGLPQTIVENNMRDGKVVRYFHEKLMERIMEGVPGTT
mmetsp:Transcript_44529/g.83144  ORF Transcript_44529/g.83144 Transcript_44529/m.83144 type:complete len:108 (-) Transcript_44529:1067-1390(-)